MRGKQKGAPLTASNAAVKKRKRPVCKVEGCTNIVQNGGVCKTHGAKVKRYICKEEGCTNNAVKGGVCVKHGAEKTKCSQDGCTNKAHVGGVCWRHGAQKTCRYEGCTNKAHVGGVCVRHGAKVKKCKFEGCTNKALKGGICVKHGAKQKRCSHEGCDNQAQKGGVCVAHGAKRKACSHNGCSNQAQVGGVCYSHGAKLKRCSHEGCNNQAQNGGMCHRHGAKRKICSQKGCTKFSQKKGLCYRHGKRRKLDGVEHDSSAIDIKDDDGTQEVPGLASDVIVDDVVNGGADVDASSDADGDENEAKDNGSGDGEEQRSIEGSDSEEELGALIYSTSVARNIRNGMSKMNAPDSITCEEDNNCNNDEATKHDQGKEDEENPSPAKLSILSGGETYANNENHKCSNGDEHGNSEERSDEMIPSEEISDLPLSPYEKLRLDKIARNNDKLRELGLDKPIAQAAKQMSKRKKKKVTSEIKRRVQPSRPAKAKLKKNVYNDEDEMLEASSFGCDDSNDFFDEEDAAFNNSTVRHCGNTAASVTGDEDKNYNGEEASEQGEHKEDEENPSLAQAAEPEPTDTEMVGDEVNVSVNEENGAFNDGIGGLGDHAAASVPLCDEDNSDNNEEESKQGEDIRDEENHSPAKNSDKEKDLLKKRIQELEQMLNTQQQRVASLEPKVVDLTKEVNADVGSKLTESSVNHDEVSKSGIEKSGKAEGSATKEANKNTNNDSKATAPKSVEALLLTFEQVKQEKIAAAKKEAKGQAASAERKRAAAEAEKVAAVNEVLSAKRKAAKAVAEKKAALDHVRCKVCEHVKDEKYVMVTCGHVICYDCYWEWAGKTSLTCPFCKRTLKAEKKTLKRIYVI